MFVISQDNNFYILLKFIYGLISDFSLFFYLINTTFNYKWLIETPTIQAIYIFIEVAIVISFILNFFVDFKEKH